MPARNDFDGDGKSDILWHNTANFFVAWKMDGATVTAQQTFGTLSSNWWVEGTGDFDGDGKTEVLWHNRDHSIEIDSLSGSSVNSLGVPGYLDSSWSVAAIADFDGDGKSDILWKNTANFYVAWFMNGAAIKSQVTLGTIAANNPWALLGAADINGDGKAEVLWRAVTGSQSSNPKSGEIEVDTLSGSGIGYFGRLASANNMTTVNGTFTAMGDFNGDGKTDILWRNTVNPTTIAYQLYLMDGLNVTKVSLGTVSSAWTVEDTGDFNGDGKTDIQWRNSNGAVAIDTITGSSFVALGTAGSLDSSWASGRSSLLHRAVQDFNGDGDSDILWQSGSNFALDLTTGVPTRHSGSAVPMDPAWSVQGLDDFNGDGKADVLWKNSSSGAVVIDQIVNGSYSSLGTAGTLDNSWSAIGVGDFDGDGKADIL